MFYREKAYTRINWKNRPNLSTPLGAKNLNKMDATLNELDDRIIEVSSEVEMDSLTIGLISDKVNSLEENVDENTSQINELSNLAEDVNGLKIVNTASGTTAYMDDASNMGLEGIDLYGESKQMQTTGKNELQNTATSRTVNGVSFTVNDDKSVTVNGTATSQAVFRIGSIDAIEGKTYALSGCPSGGSMSTYYFDMSNQVNQATKDTGNGGVLTITSSSLTYYADIFITEGTTINNLTFKPMIRDASITDATYEPYTNGPAPNPDYPQPIESKIVNRVDVSGKNLFGFGESAIDKTAELRPLVAQRLIFTKIDDNTIKCNFNGGTYSTGYVEFEGIDGTKDYAFSFIVEHNTLGFTPRIEKYASRCTTTRLSLMIYAANGATEVTSSEYIILKNIQVELGTTVTPFEQFKGFQTVNLSAPIELNGIGDVRDTDKIKKFGVVVLDGSADEGWYTMDTQTAGVKRIYTRTFKVKNSASIYVPASNILCSHYKSISASDTYLQKQGIATTTADNYIYIYDERFNTADILLWKAHLASNPITLVYELETPEETALPQADIDAIKALHSYKPNTVVMNDADAEMDVKYVSDVKIYIDRKFEALASAIVNQ